MTLQSPINVGQGEILLESHSDRSFVRFILEGLRRGFRIGFNKKKGSLDQRRGNMSKCKNKQLVSSYLERELSLGRMAVIKGVDQQLVHTSPIGLIPKKAHSGSVLP